MPGGTQHSGFNCRTSVAYSIIIVAQTATHSCKCTVYKPFINAANNGGSIYGTPVLPLFNVIKGIKVQCSRWTQMGVLGVDCFLRNICGGVVNLSKKRFLRVIFLEAYSRFWFNI